MNLGHARMTAPGAVIARSGFCETPDPCSPHNPQVRPCTQFSAEAASAVADVNACLVNGLTEPHRRSSSAAARGRFRPRVPLNDLSLLLSSGHALRRYRLPAPTGGH
jgi:hypothetical protein